MPIMMDETMCRCHCGSKAAEILHFMTKDSDWFLSCVKYNWIFKPQMQVWKPRGDLLSSCQSFFSLLQSNCFLSTEAYNLYTFLFANSQSFQGRYEQRHGEMWFSSLQSGLSARVGFFFSDLNLRHFSHHPAVCWAPLAALHIISTQTVQTHNSDRKSDGEKEEQSLTEIIW